MKSRCSSSFTSAHFLCPARDQFARAILLLFVMAACLLPAAVAQSNAAANSSAAPPPTTVTTGGGTANSFAMFTGASTIGNAIVTQTSTTAVNVNGKLNLPAKGTATSTTFFGSRPETFVASVFNVTAVPKTFLLQAEGINNNTANANATLNLLFGSGTSTPAETGFKISSKGILTFATGQVFPGTGTVLSVGSGAGLTGGPITTIGTLSIKAAGVTNAMLQHPSLTVGTGTGLAGGGAVALGGSLTLTNKGVLSVGNGSGLTNTGGQNPNLDINTSVVPTLAGVNFFSGFSDFDGNEPGWEVEVSNAGAGDAIIASNTSVDSSHPTLSLTNNDSTAAGDLVFDAVGPNFGGECSIDVTGNLFCTGTLAAAVKLNSTRGLGVYSVQSPENWIEDFGSGKLFGGVATINLDPGFVKTVSGKGDYHVFLTPAGDCEGLFVAGRTATSFEVRELKGGTSNVQFDYRIVAHRRGLEAVRLPQLKMGTPKPTTQQSASGLVAGSK